jgi:hypothetical protein
MFCPKCKAEYREGFDTCSDCNVKLVKYLPQPVHKEFSQYIKYEPVAGYINPAIIAIVKSILDANKITYYFDGEVSFFSTDARLMVKAEQVQEAKRLLKRLE